MHIGRVLIVDSETDTVLFTDWMPRQGDHAVFTTELITAIGADFAVEVYHKNSEDSGPGAAVGSLVAATTTLGLHEKQFSGLKELVRYRITVSATAGNMGGVIYRFLQVTWFDKARV